MHTNRALTLSSLLAVLLVSMHMADDAIHASSGMAMTGLWVVVVTMAAFLYGAIELRGRRSGFIITLLGGALALLMPVLHRLGPGSTKWGFEFVWTLFALGVVGAFVMVLSAVGLWRSFRAQ